MSSRTPGTEDWRVTVDLVDEHHRMRLAEALRTRHLARDARRKVGSRVIVTHDGPNLFLYADGESAAREVETAALELLAEHGLHGTVAIMRWHPIEQRWEDPSHPLPTSPEERAAEVERRGAEDRARSQRQGYPEWDVRLRLPTDAEAVAFAERLESEGIPVARGGTAIIAGADTEADAQALATRLRSEAPDGTTVAVEVNRAEAWTETHRLAFLGGLAN
jgi:hypothetical protein